MPDISDLGPIATGCFLASCLAGFDAIKPEKDRKYITVLSRLIDKAKNEYTWARESALAEEKETSLTYEEILKRNNGQYIYTCTIINHLENCINALARIYKIVRNLNFEIDNDKDKAITDVRNCIEHMDREIDKGIVGYVCLNVSEDALSIYIGEGSKTKELKIVDIAEQIGILHKKITEFI